MNCRRAAIFLCTVLAFQTIPSRIAAGTLEDADLLKSRNLILAGWLTFANAYIFSFAAGIPLLNAYGPCAASQQYSENCGMGQAIFSGIMVIPMVGPLAMAGYVFSGVEGGGAAIGLFFLLDSFAQIAGLTLAIVGHVKRYNTLKKIKGEKVSVPGYLNDRFGIAAAPFVAAGGGGIAVLGTF